MEAEYIPPIKKPENWTNTPLYKKIFFYRGFLGPVHGEYTDKLKAKEIVKSICGSRIKVAEVVRILSGPTDLQKEDIQKNHFIKATHGSGWLIDCATDTDMKENNYWLIGGDIYNLKSTNYKIVRKTENDDIETNTRMTVYTIDGGGKNNRICLKYDRDYVYIGKNSSRTVATLHIYNKNLTEEEQIDIVNRFNILLEERREMYNSLFLSNYRESKEYARKRISFDLVYNIVSSLL